MTPRPSLRAGMSNRAVKAMQNGLHRALAAHGHEHVNLRNGGYGSRTIRDVETFKRVVGLPANGRAFGSDAWRALDPYLGPYDERLIDRHLDDVRLARARAEARAQELADPRGRLRSIALEFYAAREHYVYRQVRPMPDCLLCPDAYARLDCSSSVTLMYRESALEDPNGLGYSGQGYTGTLWGRGQAVDTPQAGDLCFYGYDSRGPFPSHVAICIGAGEVVSFGSTPIRRATVRYRSDYRGARSYL